jgi:hypothetical protein
LAFLHAQAQWGRQSSWFWVPLVEFLRAPANISRPWNLTALNFLCALLLLGAGLHMLVRRRPRWMGVYTLACVLLPLSSGSLQSMSRYTLCVFPLFLWLGAAGRERAVDRFITVTFSVLLGWMWAWFIMRVDFALA